MSNISRRSFLKGSAMGATGVVALGITGCSNPSSANKSKVETALEYNWQNSMSPLSEAKYEADIVIVGRDMSGMSTDIEAATLGLKVIVLEQLSFVGGTTNFADGVFCYDSKWTREMGNKYDPVEMLEGAMDYLHYHAYYDHIKDFILKSPENLQWLIDMEVTFHGQPGGEIYKVQHYYEGQGKAVINNCMKPRADKLGVEFLLETTAKHLYMNSGKIEGILAENKDGLSPIKAKSVVLGTGEFLNNAEMVSKYLRIDTNRLVYGGTPEHNGDDIRMSFEVGANQYGRMCAGFVYTHVKSLRNFSHSDVAACNEPYFWINDKGSRFINEAVIGTLNHICYVIFI